MKNRSVSTYIPNFKQHLKNKAEKENGMRVCESLENIN